MRTNAIKRKMQAGVAVVGSFLYIPSSKLAEIVGWCGYDFVVIDCEHGSVDEETVEDMVRAAESTDTTVLVRVPHSSPELVLKALDSGALGVHVPEINTREDAVRFARSCRYAPEGTRGLAGVRPARYGLGVKLDEYVVEANREVLSVAHIESADAVDALGEILEVDGIDVYYLGPVDLSNSLGIPGRTSDPAVVERVESSIKRITAAGKIAGCIARDVETAKRYIDLGARYIASHALAEMYSGARRFLDAVRS